MPREDGRTVTVDLPGGLVLEATEVVQTDVLGWSVIGHRDICIYKDADKKELVVRLRERSMGDEQISMEGE